ncbi:fungal specific transcription factor domain-containing protein [Phlyctema vagabunda]|uniref:Fungal specific transcription factor domain-containing protein n=1 Tax=Phlyctema vagabunda TaxID=108571 RepID=A0ABR4P1A5_9HELO
MSQTMDEGPRRESPVALTTRVCKLELFLDVHQADLIKACDMCRKKKIRCETVADTCAQCIKYKTPCHFTPISMKRTPRRSPKAKHIHDLEQSLKQMEAQLKRAVAQQPITKYQEGNTFELPETPNSDHFQTEMYKNPQMEVDRSSDDMVLPAEIHLQPVVFAQPPQNTPSRISVNRVVSFPFFNDGCEGNIYLHPLPPMDKGNSLIEKSFQGFNHAFPIFDRESFLFKYRSTESTINTAGWWACLNVVLALSHRFTGTTITEKEQDQEAWGYFKNALAGSNQLMTMAPSIESVQALIGMALLFLGTPNQGPVSLFISSAIKLAQGMGLHRSYRQSTLQASEIEHRKRIFWSAYAIDKDLSLTTGQPPTQNDDDMDAELPTESDSEILDVFYFRIRLAIIQGQIYKHLCSAKSYRQPPSQRIMAARKLETMLQSWKATMPAEILQGHAGSGHGGVNSIILRLSYFNSLSTVYSSLPMFPMFHELQVSQHPKITYEARKAIKLLEATPRRSYACLWAVFPIYVTASTTLLNYALSQPSNKSAIMDLQLSKPLLQLLVTLARISEGQREEVADMYRSTVELFQKAKMAIEGSKLRPCRMSQSQSQSQPQGAPEGKKESVEDFLMRMESLSAGYEHFDLNLLSPSTLAWVESHNKRR